MRLYRSHKSCFPFVLLIAAYGVVPSTDASNAPITASLDAANRSVWLEPIGISIRIPDNMAVDGFYARPDFMNIVAILRPTGFLPLEIYFQPSACSEWFASSAKNKRKKTQKPGAGLFDERWNQTWLASDEWNYFCLDRPDSGSIRIDTSAPLEKLPREPFYRFTANMADAFQVQGSGAGGTSAVAPATATDVSGIAPGFAANMANLCSNGDQPQCQALATYRSYHQSCIDGGRGQCSAAGAFSESAEDFETAALYFQRSCDLGNADACQKAKKNARKAN